MSLKSRFCPKCGKEIKELVDGKCINCYYKSLKIKFPGKIIINICDSCGSVLLNNIWMKNGTINYWLAEKAKQNIKLPKNVKLENLKVVQTGENGKIRLWLSIKGEIFTESKELPIYVKERRCPECKSKRGNTWNSKVQVRADKEIVEKIFKAIPKKEILKIRNVKNGIDIYFLKKDAGKSFARKMKNEFKLSSKSSFEQRGWDKMKNTSYKLPVIRIKKE